MSKTQDPGPGPAERGSHTELYALQSELRASNMLTRVILGICVLAVLLFWYSTRVNPLDRSMKIQATEIEKAIQRYYSEELDYPDSLDDVKPYLSVTDVWPHEPYSGRNMEDTGSAEFDGELSVGMVHYEHIESNDNSGYMLIVFGRRGVLETRYGGHTGRR